MRQLFALVLILFVSFNLQAAPRDNSNTAVNDMFVGVYSCTPGTSDFYKDLRLLENTHMSSADNNASSYGAFDCSNELSVFESIIQPYCSYSVGGTGNSRITFVCRGSREDVVNLTTDMFEHVYIP